MARTRWMTEVAACARRLAREDTGQNLIEYGLIVGLIGLAAVASMKTFNNTFLTFWDREIMKVASVW